jgi:putative hemolysin
VLAVILMLSSGVKVKCKAVLLAYYLCANRRLYGSFCYANNNSDEVNEWDEQREVTARESQYCGGGGGGPVLLVQL